MHEIVRAAGLTGYRTLVRQLGGDPLDILARVGLDEDALREPDRYIAYRKVLLAIEEAAQVLNVKDFGLQLARQQDLGFLGTLSLAIQSARSVREGLIMAARYIHFHTPGVAIHLDGADRQGLEAVRLDFLLKDMPPIAQSTEHAICHLCNIVDLLSNGRLAPLGIYFRHRHCATEAVYREHFGQLPVFEAGFDGIKIHSADIRWPIPGKNEQLQAFVERFLIGVSPPPEWPLPQQLRDVLQNLSRTGPVCLDDAARVLRLHPRALQRRLKALGVSFRDILDDVRREMAQEFLANRSMPLASVAQAVGFADQAVLTRACQRWFGGSPKACRKALADGRKDIKKVPQHA